MITEQQIRDYLFGPDDTTTIVASLLLRATTMVAAETDGSYVPQEIIDLAVLTLAAELNLRQSNPGGVLSYNGQDTPSRLSRDPMVAVRPIISDWVVKM